MISFLSVPWSLPHSCSHKTAHHYLQIADFLLKSRATGAGKEAAGNEITRELLNGLLSYTSHPPDKHVSLATSVTGSFCKHPALAVREQNKLDLRAEWKVGGAERPGWAEQWKMRIWDIFTWKFTWAAGSRKQIYWKKYIKGKYVVCKYRLGKYLPGNQLIVRFSSICFK